jgi:hypothetical protein
MVVDPVNPAILYAGSDRGIYRSSNHGFTGSWAFIGKGSPTLRCSIWRWQTPQRLAPSRTG